MHASVFLSLALVLSRCPSASFKFRKNPSVAVSRQSLIDPGSGLTCSAQAPALSSQSRACRQPTTVPAELVLVLVLALPLLSLRLLSLLLLRLFQGAGQLQQEKPPTRSRQPPPVYLGCLLATACAQCSLAATLQSPGRLQCRTRSLPPAQQVRVTARVRVLVQKAGPSKGLHARQQNQRLPAWVPTAPPDH